jgi:hypothetical protein
MDAVEAAIETLIDERMQEQQNHGNHNFVMVRNGPHGWPLMYFRTKYEAEAEADAWFNEFEDVESVDIFERHTARIQ